MGLRQCFPKCFFLWLRQIDITLARSDINSDLPDLHAAQWGIEAMVLAFNRAVKESVLKTSLFPSSQMIYILSNYMCYVQFGELA